jgi:glycosyltransferase involved in cell wall biosynthesis
MTKIGLLMQGGRGWIGGAEYIKNIVLALASLPNEIRQTFDVSIVGSEPAQSDLYCDIRQYLSHVHEIEESMAPPTLVNRIRWKLSEKIFKQKSPRFEDFFIRQKLDFVYPYWSKAHSRTNLRSAAWIPDFQHKYLPDFFTSEDLEYRDAQFALAARHADKVVLSSKDAERDFHQYFPDARHKTEVLSFKTTPLSAWYEKDPKEVQKIYSLPDKFFIVSNQFWQHKNHLIIFKALKLLQEQCIYPIVVCTGHMYDYRMPSYSDTVLQNIHKLGLARQVSLLGLIPKNDQVQLMRRSIAVLQPSLFEGWSTLVEDAKSLGKDVISSDLPVNIEQNPLNKLFFERNSADELAALLSICWKQGFPGPDLNREYAARVERFSDVQSFGYRFLEIARGSQGSLLADD